MESLTNTDNTQTSLEVPFSHLSPNSSFSPEKNVHNFNNEPVVSDISEEVQALNSNAFKSGHALFTDSFLPMLLEENNEVLKEIYRTAYRDCEERTYITTKLAEELLYRFFRNYFPQSNFSIVLHALLSGTVDGGKELECKVAKLINAEGEILVDFKNGQTETLFENFSFVESLAEDIYDLQSSNFTLPEHLGSVESLGLSANTVMGVYVVKPLNTKNAINIE